MSYNATRKDIVAKKENIKLLYSRHISLPPTRTNCVVRFRSGLRAAGLRNALRKRRRLYKYQRKY